MTDDDEDVPPRVLAAEARRRFREVMSQSSIGCPLDECDHVIGQHYARDYDRLGTPINPVCAVPGCGCGRM